MVQVLVDTMSRLIVVSVMVDETDACLGSFVHQECVCDAGSYFFFLIQEIS